MIVAAGRRLFRLAMEGRDAARPPTRPRTAPRTEGFLVHKVNS